MVVNLKENEVVIKARTGNHILGTEKIPGKMIITNQRVYFYSMDSSPKILKIEIEPADIHELNYFKTKLVVPNGLSVMLKNGNVLSFLLKKRDEMGLLINKMY